MDARIIPQPFVQLPVTDVDGSHLDRTSLQHAVGEPTSRRAGVEHSLAMHVNPKSIERGVHFFPTPAHEPRRRLLEADGLTGTDEAGDIRRRRATDDDPAGRDRTAGLVSRSDQTSADQLGLEPPSCSRWPA